MQIVFIDVHKILLLLSAEKYYINDSASKIVYLEEIQIFITGKHTNQITVYLQVDSLRKMCAFSKYNVGTVPCDNPVTQPWGQSNLQVLNRGFQGCV